LKEHEEEGERKLEEFTPGHRMAKEILDSVNPDEYLK